MFEKTDHIGGPHFFQGSRGLVESLLPDTYGVIHIWRPLWGGGGRVGVDKNEMLSDVSGWGVRECSGRPILFFLLLKKIGFAPWQSIMLSQTLIYYWQEIFNFTLISDSEAIQIGRLKSRGWKNFGRWLDKSYGHHLCIGPRCNSKRI